MKHHYANKVQDILKAYESTNHKLEEKIELLKKGSRSAPSGKRREKAYCFPNVPHKHTINDLIAEVKVRESMRIKTKQTISINPEAETISPETKACTLKSRSAQIIDLRNPLDVKRLSEKKI